jgi:hypothetical protein
MTEGLEKLLGGATRFRLIKLFIFNPDLSYNQAEIVKRLNSSSRLVRKELTLLENIGFIKSRRRKAAKGKANTFLLNQKFIFLNSLRDLVNPAKNLVQAKIISKAIKLGKINLLLLSGIFIDNSESRIDVLLVGDAIKKQPLLHFIKFLESEMGRDIRYTFFPTKEFRYRLSMFDKLVRDVMDYPHIKVINKLYL